MSQKLQECFKCRDAGFPGQQFYFAGKKGDVWLMNNPDGTEHVHKVKQEAPKPASALTPEQQRAADIQRLHNENIEASKLLTQSINRLAAALEVRK